MIPTLAGELVVDARCALGEGPLWDHRTGILHWVDIEGGAVHSLSPADGSHRRVGVPGRPGCLGLTADPGRLVAAMETEIVEVALADGTVRHVASVPTPAEGAVRFNDGKVDAVGRLWAGTMGLGKGPERGVLYRWVPGAEPVPLFGGIGVSNGLAWTADARTFYHVDSPRRRVTAYPCDPPTGTLGEGRVAVETAAYPGFPDGMAIDAEGMLWVAFWDGGCVRRFDPATGALLAVVEVPAARATACAFGGPDLDVLYITSARVGLDEARLGSAAAASGGLFCCRPGVRGVRSGILAGG